MERGINMLKKGDIIECIVSGIEEYGFFIKTKDDYSGLVHISEISENYIRNIYDYVINKKLKLSIKDINYRICTNLPQDVEKGFKSLKENLPIWIDEIEEEIKKATK